MRHYCPNTLCPARVGQEFGHFAGRGGMDIEGAGWMVVSQLLQRGMLKHRGDFFRLTVDDLVGLDRFAQKSAENLYANIQKARVRPLARIINALGIPQVGEQTAIDMANWMAGRWPPADDEPMGGAGWLVRARRAGAAVASARRVPGGDGHRPDGGSERRAAGSRIRRRRASWTTWSTPAWSRSARPRATAVGR